MDHEKLLKEMHKELGDLHKKYQDKIACDELCYYMAVMVTQLMCECTDEKITLKIITKAINDAIHIHNKTKE